MNNQTIVNKLNKVFWDKNLNDYDVANEILNIMDDNREIIQFDSALSFAYKLMNRWSRKEIETGYYLDTIKDILNLKNN